MHINWHDVWTGITSPEEGFKALWWDLIKVLIIVPIYIKVHGWVKSWKPSF